jgi:hypothetical protein
MSQSQERSFEHLARRGMSRVDPREERTSDK